MIVMYKVGVVGDRDSIIGFKSLGVDVVPVLDADETSKAINQLARNNYAVIFITEDVALTARETINKYTNKAFPAIILIPGNQGSTGAGMLAIRESVKKAIGTEIVFGDE